MSTAQQETLSIEGMGCDHCVKSVRESLGAIPGVTVEGVEIGQAVVRYDDPATHDALVQAVEDAGFSVAA